VGDGGEADSGACACAADEGTDEGDRASLGRHSTRGGRRVVPLSGKLSSAFGSLTSVSGA